MLVTAPGLAPFGPEHMIHIEYGIEYCFLSPFATAQSYPACFAANLHIWRCRVPPWSRRLRPSPSLWPRDTTHLTSVANCATSATQLASCPVMTSVGKCVTWRQVLDPCSNVWSAVDLSACGIHGWCDSAAACRWSIALAGCLATFVASRRAKTVSMTWPK